MSYSPKLINWAYVPMSASASGNTTPLTVLEGRLPVSNKNSYIECHFGASFKNRTNGNNNIVLKMYLNGGKVAYIGGILNLRPTNYALHYMGTNVTASNGSPASEAVFTVTAEINANTWDCNVGISDCSGEFIIKEFA